MLIYKLFSTAVLLTVFQPSFCQSLLQWRDFLYFLIPLRQFFSACSLQAASIQTGRTVVHKETECTQVSTSYEWKHEQKQNRGKSSKEILFLGLANFYLIVNENICSKGFCFCNLHLLKVNWKIQSLCRKSKSVLIIVIEKKSYQYFSFSFERLTSETAHRPWF